jgi:hypothetical protein
VEPDNVRRLPLNLGSLRYLSLTVSRVEWTRSWTLRFYHVHDSQKYMECPSEEYEGLALTEVIDVACSLLAGANDDYKACDDGHCSPRPGPTGGGDHAA